MERSEFYVGVPVFYVVIDGKRLINVDFMKTFLEGKINELVKNGEYDGVI